MGPNQQVNPRISQLHLAETDASVADQAIPLTPARDYDLLLTDPTKPSQIATQPQNFEVPQATKEPYITLEDGIFDEP